MSKINKNPHLLKRHSLFAMFCLSYFPLFILLSIKIFLAKIKYLNYGGFNGDSIWLFFKSYSFLFILLILSIYAFWGTAITFKKILNKKSNSFPVKITSIKSKNEEALSYLATYVIPLLAQGNVGAFEYATFVVLFIIYYKLYSTSNLILINPILNMRYGLFDINYFHISQQKETKNALIISNQKWIDEDDEISIIKLSHRLYFAY
jgi:hypothetical protein